MGAGIIFGDIIQHNKTAGRPKAGIDINPFRRHR